MTRRPDTDAVTPTKPSGPGSPSEPASTTHVKAPPLPRPPPAPPPALPPAEPGERGDAPSDVAVTTRLERVNLEPEPLPPSPAAADADRYFEQVPTSPGVVRRDPTGVSTGQRTAFGEIPAPRRVIAPPPRQWLLPVLLVATGLAVGMVLGALIFGNRSAAPPCPPCPPAATSVGPSGR